MADRLESWQRSFLFRHQLNDSYLKFAEKWFEGVIADILKVKERLGRPVLVAVNGCQGSGKSTLCDYLVASLQVNRRCSAISLSLDDFYVPREQRIDIAAQVHPLFITRGAPGTHDVTLLESTLDRLASATAQTVTRIPRFDKASDDRKPESEWDEVIGLVDVVFIEGWCLGAVAESAQALSEPINTLEASEDASGLWRSHANCVLKEAFEPLYELFDLWIMLAAPSFDCVYRWRLEQEKKLADTVQSKSGSGVMSEQEVARFIQFYERLTENCLRQLPQRVNFLYRLDEDRRVLSFHRNIPGSR